MVTLYTLPSCGICNMVKTKLKQKNIAFEEKEFPLIAQTLQSDHAPVLEDEQHNFYNSPTSIVEWINNYRT